MMRDSFVLSGDCSYSFEINPDDFPFPPLALCTIPDFTTPTMVIHIPEIIPPDISPPELCHCFTFNVTHSITLGSSPPAADCIGDSDSQQPKIDFNIQRLTQDCCDMAFSVNLDLDIPCMPFDIQADFVALRAGGQAQPGGIIFAADKRDSTCAWDVDLSISIPCMPFEMRTTSTIEIGDKLSMLFDITRGSSVEQTRIIELFTLMEFTGISYDSTLMPNVTHTLVPEVTFTLGTYFFSHPSCGWTSTVQEIPVTRMVSVPTIVMLPELIATKFVCEETRPAGYTHTVETGPPCEFELNLDLELPCLPLAMNLTREIVEKAEITSPEMRFSAKRDTTIDDSGLTLLATCEWNFELSIAIPESITCAEISLDASSDIVLKSNLIAPTIRFDVIKPVGESGTVGCEWDFELSIALPDGGFSCADLDLTGTGVIGIGDTSDPEIKVSLINLADTCNWEVYISLLLPDNNFSCAALDFSHEETIVIKQDIDAPEIRFEVIENPETCDYQFELSIAIPEVCDPIFRHSQHMTQKCTKKPEMRFGISVGTCDYKFDLSILIPKMPTFRLTEDIVYKDDIEDPTIRFDVSIGTCDYLFELSIAIPEPCKLDFSHEETIVKKAIEDPEIRFDILSVATCHYKFELSIAIPEGLTGPSGPSGPAGAGGISCGDISLQVIDEIITAMDIASPAMRFDISKSLSCVWDFDLSIAIPQRFSCGDIDLTLFAAAQHIVEKELPLGPEIAVRWVDVIPGLEAACEYQLQVSIAIPNRFSCGDINIEAGTPNQTIVEKNIPQPEISAAFIKSLDPCDFQFHISIAIPNRFSCGDMDMTIVEPNQTIVQADIAAPTMRFEVKDADPPPAGGTCERQFELSIAIPESITCGDINITALANHQDITFKPAIDLPEIRVQFIDAAAVGLDIPGGEECEWRLQVSIGLPSYPDVSDFISCGDIHLAVAKHTIVQAAIPDPTMMLAVTPGNSHCTWNFDLSIAIPSGGGGGGISCGELSGGVLIDVGADCTINHDCDGLLAGVDINIYPWRYPYVNFSGAANTITFYIDQCKMFFTCGHVYNYECTPVDVGINLPYITCGDLTHGPDPVSPAAAPGDWLSIGADCTIMHRISGLYDNNDGEAEFLGLYGGDLSHAIDVTINAGGDVGIEFKQQDLLFNVAEGHLKGYGIQAATPVTFFNTFPGKTDTITLIGPGSSVNILEFKNGLLWTVS
jgi:hypothetical protein